MELVASAQARLQHQILYACLPENDHANQKQQFEIGRMWIALLFHFIDAVHDLLKGHKKCLVRHLLLIDDKALIDVYQMGGSKKTRAFARRMEDGGQERAYGALSVGARHMQDLHTVFRTPKPF